MKTFPEKARWSGSPEGGQFMRSFARFCFWRKRRPALRALARGLARAMFSTLRPAGRRSPLISPVQGERARAAVRQRTVMSSRRPPPAASAARSSASLKRSGSSAHVAASAASLSLIHI